MIRSPLIATLVALSYIPVQAQLSTRGQLEQAVQTNQWKVADSLLKAKLEALFTAQQLDSLPPYLMYAGKIADKLQGSGKGEAAVNALLQHALSFHPGPRLLSRLYAEAGEYLGAAGNYTRAYASNEKAYAYARQVPGIEPEVLASIDSDLGTFAFRKGDVALAQQHHRKAIAVYLRSSHPDNESLYTAANNMASQYWLSSKLDSALYFYDIALKSLSRADRTPINQYYRPSVLQNNMAAVFNMQGQTRKAIDAMQSCIRNLRFYLSLPETVPKKPNSENFLYECIDNLGGIYKELGDYAQALALEQYSYRQKQQKAAEDPSGVYKSQVLLGQLYYAMRDHEKAVDYLNLALRNMGGSEDDLLFWQADACNTLALLYEKQKDTKLAAFYYSRADSLYEVSLQGEYDDIYLEFLRNAALFHATNNQLPKAQALAEKGFAYVRKTQGTETLLAFYQLLNLAEIHLLAHQYPAALNYSQQGLSVVEKMIHGSAHLLDSVKIELKKPRALLLKAQAEYALLQPRTVAALKPLLAALNQAAGLLERRKTLIRDPKDIGLMIADNKELLDFIQTLNLELYRLTGDQGAIDQLLNLQESCTYSRLRARLDQSDSIRFAHLPASLQLEERRLKEGLSKALEQEGAPQQALNAYFTAEKQWNAFLEKLRTTYPDYYKMRYQAVLTSVAEVQRSIPANTTVLRYLFVNQELFAIVLDRTARHLVPLPLSQLETDIRAVSGFSTSLPEASAALHRLYRQLWAPLQPHIKNKRVVIIPDGLLFNLNFEVLTPTPISAWNQLGTRTLLADYTLSYHYSLALLGQQKKAEELSDPFIAFAPGFLDAEKQRYKASVKDSFQLDRDYITLLPQPFTVDLASRTRALLGGEAYVNSASTADRFRQLAGRHKIIHIGTHAESNNLAPEFSRLIFAKTDGSAPNSVYLHDLYNCDLRAELAVLTACESGKPGYADGEGMISLAHAFNYAGSESILTGLWKIDEQASTILMEAFYRYLTEGKAKDEALRLAKLDYLKKTHGRTLAPAYWAGLVLMGDTAPIELEKKRTIPLWIRIAGGILGILLSALVFRQLVKRGVMSDEC